MVAYLTQDQLEEMGFKKLGANVKVSDKASIYDHEKIEIGDNSRIDDFCVVSGNVTIGKYVHIAAFCLLAGGNQGIKMDDFTGLAYGVQVFTQSDDYSGRSMTNPTIPKKYKIETMKPVDLGRHTIVGAGSIIMPGVTLNEGTAVGAMSLVRKTTEPWCVYLGNPAKKIKNRKEDLLKLEQEFLEEVEGS